MVTADLRGMNWWRGIMDAMTREHDFPEPEKRILAQRAATSAQTLNVEQLRLQLDFGKTRWP